MASKFLSSSPPLSSSSKLQSPSRTCLCAPTIHPGSFRCKLHRNGGRKTLSRPAPASVHPLASSPASRSNRAGEQQLMLGVLIRVIRGSGTGSKVKSSLRAVPVRIISPSQHDLDRRRNFQPRPSRFRPTTAGGV